ncbi:MULTISPECIES: DUF1802 family protein [Cyanophyceae]|uniref:DUF1802 family protein n=1 Tax=Cyanophyceae TaxID=3028117 RepID=UPI0016896C6D|nr:DUF1802 family protein [Trichocoleus sp. FACHB-40]MBD2006162.1 DUF1802 family protein [Trichocoleus sp. FACHB-40]
MSPVSSVNLDTALRLPAPDIEALIQGRMIAFMPRTFLSPGFVVALYPADISTDPLPIEQHYRSGFLPIAKSAIAQLHHETVTIKAWARCELCLPLKKPESLEALSRLTIWTTEALQQILSQRHCNFLAHLRVYLLPQPFEMPHNTQDQFVGLPHSLSVTDATPVLSDHIFAQRSNQLENRLPPLHPELEELQSAIASLTITNQAAEELEQHIKVFLGWSSDNLIKQLNKKLDWITSIAALGNRSKELDEGKSNYQAGTDFENIVRRSLEFLGFTVDEAYKGGAGGLDLFCSKPYPLVGECKAGRSIGNIAVKELVQLGGTHLGTDEFIGTAKLIIGPGEPTVPLLKAADEWKVSIINPMTLQKLVEIQAKYPGSVNLLELKPYLEAGQIDYKIDEYIQKVLKDINLRSQIVKTVKELSEPGSDYPTAIEIRTHYNARFAENQSSKLSDDSVHDLLIELSSPLTGYLGRKKGTDWRSDRFYFLRDLSMDT